MDTNTGRLYKNRDEALAAGVRKEDVVELKGSKEAIKKISYAVQRHYNFKKASKKRKMQKESRKKNRR